MMVARPDTESTERAAMSGIWQTIADICAGAAQVRAMKQRYLPKYEAESDREYDRRVACAPWRPEFSDALRSLALKPFAKDISLSEATSETIKALAENIDGRGNSLTVFAKEGFGRGLSRGLHAIFVDYPPAPGNLSKADERASGARPYWVHVRAENLIALHTKFEGGNEVIQHARFRETALIQDGFGERLVSRIRVLEPGKWELWEQTSGATDQAYVLAESGVISRGPSGASSVPLVLFYAGERLGNLSVIPPLADLAMMQIELYQALSRQEEILTFAGSPMLCAVGMAPPAKGGAAIAVGPKTVLFAPPAADGSSTSWTFVQPNPGSIDAIHTHVQSIIEDMRRLGMQPSLPRTGTLTATGQAIDASNAHSAVKAWALSYQDAIEQALVYTAEWLGEESTAEAVIYTDFDAMPMAETPLATLRDAHQDRVISRVARIQGLKRFSVLPADFDESADEERLQQELEGLDGSTEFGLEAPPQADAPPNRGLPPAPRADAQRVPARDRA